jgi:uncharacterized protein (TIGR03083 family)
MASSLVDRTIAVLRSESDQLAELVPSLSDDQLIGPSGASEWTVAQVLSHLGSGAEITRADFEAAVTGSPGPGGEFNQGVWDRWNALSPVDQAAGCLEQNAALITGLEAMSPEQRGTLQVRLRFLPAPLPLASFAGMRLTESVLHGWDVRVALDPAAELAADAALLVAEQLSGGLSFMSGFIGKADAVSTPAVVEVQGSGFGFVIKDGVSLTSEVSDPTATFVGPLAAAIRLVGGRLTAKYTPDGVHVIGNVTLDDLRQVFPGY